MTRFFLGLMAVVLLSVQPVRADDDLARALAAVRAQDWNSARSAAQAVEDRAARDVVQWMLLRASQGNFAETLDFLTRRGDWPGLPLLRVRSEETITADADPRAVAAFFAQRSARTAQGVLRHAEALEALGQRDAAAQVVTAHWRSEPMAFEDQVAFLFKYSDLLAPHHAARADALAWSGDAISAERMLTLLSEDDAALIRARIALRREANGVDALIEAIPTRLQGDPGLAYERFRWRLSKGRVDGALEILLPQSTGAAALGRPEIWARHRENLARRLMREGRAREAYRVAADHYLTVSYDDFAENEWIAGYIALRYLNNARGAADHFRRFRGAVASPISVGRAGYWLGRAEEAAGNAEAARAAYAEGAVYQTSFYGQLAAERVGIPMDPRLTGAESFPDWRQAEFVNSSVLRAALVLLQAGELSLAERFMTHLAESLTREEVGQLIDLALELKQPHVAVLIAKRAAQDGHELHKGYFPVTAIPSVPAQVSRELILSITRRESEFDPKVISGAGARGMMQLMPRTAEAMAEATGVPYSGDRLLTDPVYNMALGAAYLAVLEEEFGQSLILVPAGYNAGPSRARRWREERGDPHAAGVDVIDWIEHIPFSETRNYVMRVAESIPIYRARLSGKTGPMRLSAELKAR